MGEISEIIDTTELTEEEINLIDDEIRTRENLEMIFKGKKYKQEVREKIEEL